MNKKQMLEYRIWKAMKSRCYAPSQVKGNYKKNNIKVCDRWLHSFENFLADMGTCPYEDASIERIDNLGNYCPENCKWIHASEQPKNRSTTRWFSLNGKCQCLRDWARDYNMNYQTLVGRIKRGMSFEDAINIPLISNGKQVKKFIVEQYSLSGELIATYNGTLDASQSTGFDASSISKVCRGEKKTCKGYFWKYKQESEDKAK